MQTSTTVNRGKVEDICRLSPVQQGMLLHRLQHPSDDAGVLLLRGRLDGFLDPDIFEDAWRRTIARHPTLRSSIHWADLKHPVQVVARDAPLAIEYHDWRSRSADERRTSWEQRLAENRQRGLDITRSPAFSVTLVREEDHRHELLWCCHHILLDGWSGAIVLREVLEWHRALIQQREPRLPAVRPFRDYLAWLAARNTTDAERFWRTRLAGVSPDSFVTSGIPAPLHPAAEAAPGLVTAPLVSDDIHTWCRRERVTVSSVLLAAWALLVHRRTGARIPVIGVTLSGRSAALDGTESMVGVFANTLPLPMRIDAELTSAAWCRSVLQQQLELQRFEHCSMGEILRWTGLSLRRPLFDSLVVHANYPGHRPRPEYDRPQPDAMAELTSVGGGVTSVYPLTMLIKPERGLSVDLLYDGRRFDRSAMAGVLSEFTDLVQRLASYRHATLAGLIDSRQGKRAHHIPANTASRGVAAAAAPDDVARRRFEPPANPIEAQLMRIFDDLIDVRQVGRNDNFFALGGDSLLLPRLIDRIEQDFRVTLPLGVVFQGPTIKELAAAVQSQTSTYQWQSLVGIRRGGDRPPLFLVHGLGGEIGFGYDVAEALHPEQPVYGLQPPADPATSLDRLASHYVEAIRRQQPHGPYLLAGYCLGGVIAFEMAQQLAADGDRAALLAIIDSASPDAGPTASPLQRQLRRVRRLATKPPRELAAALARRAAGTASHLLPRYDATTRDDGAPRWSEGMPAAFHDIATRHYHLARAYTPRHYAGDVWLFRTEDDRFATDLGWRRWVQGRLTIEMLPGDHGNVLKPPHVRNNARRLGAAIDAVLSSAALR
jgi:thioesterase domain-containing protein/acyl carrier protein